MNEIFAVVGDTKIFLNQSRVQMYNDCHRKYWWKNEENLDLDRPQKALEIGSGLHAGLAALGAGKPMSEALELGAKSIQDSFPSRRLEGDIQMMEEWQDEVNRILPAYVEFWGQEKMFKPLGVEIKFCIEVGTGTNVFLVGTIDKLVVADKQLSIVDHKSAAKMDLRELMKYEMDLQFTAYLYAINKHFSNEGRPLRVSTIIVDMLVKTKVPQFARERYIRSDDELAEFEAEFVEVAKEIAWRRHRVVNGENPKTVFYKNTKECFRYGTCPWRALCLKDTVNARATFIDRSPDYVDAFQADDLARTTSHLTGSGGEVFDGSEDRKDSGVV